MIATLKNLATQNKTLLTQYSSFVLFRVIAIAIFAVSLSVFVNSCPEGEYGTVAIGLSLLVISVVFEVGISFVIMQLAGRRFARRGTAHGVLFNRLTWFFVTIVFAIVLALIGVIVALGIPTREKYLYANLVALLPLLTVSGVATALYQAHGELVLLNFSRFIYEAGKGVAIAASGYFTHSYQMVGPILLIFALVRVFADLRMLKARLGYSLHKPTRVFNKRALRLGALGIPSAAAASLTTFVNVIDKLLIAAWYSKQDVAYYSVALDLNTKSYLIVQALNSTLLTVWLHGNARRTDSSGTIRFAVIVVIAVVLMYYIPLAMFSGELLKYWINPEFAVNAHGLVAILAISSGLYLVGNVFEVALLAHSKATLILRVNAIAVIALFACYALLPRVFGLSGFAMSSVGMNAVYLIAVYVSFRNLKFFRRPGVNVAVGAENKGSVA